MLLLGCQKKQQLPQICFEETCFDLEIADDTEEREQGLMWREELNEDAWMLFVFEQSRVSRFWMKNTLIPLDMLWLDEWWKVVYIEHDVLPCEADPCPTYGPTQEVAKYVLELNAGSANEFELHIGDIAEMIGL